MRNRFSRFVSSVVILTSWVTWAAPAFALRQTGLEESEPNRARLEERLRREGNAGNFPGGYQNLSRAGLEEAGESLRRLAQGVEPASRPPAQAMVLSAPVVERHRRELLELGDLLQHKLELQGVRRRLFNGRLYLVTENLDLKRLFPGHAFGSVEELERGGPTKVEIIRAPTLATERIYRVSLGSEPVKEPFKRYLSVPFPGETFAGILAQLRAIALGLAFHGGAPAETFPEAQRVVAALQELAGPSMEIRAGLEEGIGSAPIKHEVIREFTSQFLSGRLPSGSSVHLLELSHISNPQLSTQWIGVATVFEEFVGAARGVEDRARRREIKNMVDLRAQKVQELVARARGLLLDHVNFETKGVVPEGLQAGQQSGDPEGRLTPTVSDVIEHTDAFVDGTPGASSIQMEGPGARTFGSFPDEARALMVVTHIDRSLEKQVLEKYGAQSIDDLLDPALPVDLLIRRVVELNGVHVSQLDTTILTSNEDDVAALKALQETYEGFQFDRVTSGTVQPSLADLLGVRDGRVRLFLRRSGMTEADFMTKLAGIFTADGAYANFRVVSEQGVKSGDPRHWYEWPQDVLGQLHVLREPWGDFKTIQDGKKIFSSRQVREEIVGAYTFLTNGRTDRRLPFDVPGIRQDNHISTAHTLAFASNPEQAGAGFLWLSKDAYDLRAGLEEFQLGPFPAIPAFLEHLKAVQPERLEHIRRLLSKDGTAPFLAADQGPGSTWGRPTDSDGRQGVYRAAVQREGLSLSDDEMFFQLKALLAKVLSPHYFSAILLDHPSLQYIRNQEKMTGESILAPQAAVLVRREGPWKKGDPLPSWYSSTQEPKYRLDPTTSAEAMRTDGADGVKLLINWDKGDPIYNRYYLEEVYNPSARETVQTQMPHVVEIVTPDPAKEDPRPVATKVAHILDSIRGISAQPTLPDVWKLEAPGRVKALMAQPEALKALLALPANSSADQIRDALKGFPDPVQAEALEFIGGVRSIGEALNRSGRPALLLTAGVSGAEFEVQYALVTKFGGQEVEGPFAGHLAGRGVWRAQLRLSDPRTFAPQDFGEMTWQQVKGTIRQRLEGESVPYSVTKLAPITAQFARRLQIPAAGLEEARVMGKLFLAFDPAAGRPLLEAQGQVAIVVTHPRQARFQRQLAVEESSLVGVVGGGLEEADYLKEVPGMKQFVKAELSSPDWRQAVIRYAWSNLSQPGQQVIVIYDADSLSAGLADLGFSGAGLEEVLQSYRRTAALLGEMV